MIDFAQITFQGRLTEDPEMRTLDGGRSMCKFRVAVNRRVPGSDSEKTSFIPVTVFGKDAVNCGQFLSKGKGVHVTGEFETDNYTDKDGNKRTGFGCVARHVIFGYGGRKEEGEDDNRGGPYDKAYNRTRSHMRGGRGS